MDDRVFPGERSTSALLERDREITVLDTLIADTRRSRGRLLLVEGPAGIGKTRLLEALRERAREAGAGVLAARGGELERDFGFGIVRQLLEPPLAAADADERPRLLGGAARLAEPVLAADPVALAEPVDPAHGVLHGLYWLIANLAERSPLMLVVDDLHWADRPSLRFLHYLARRLDGLRVVIAVATRSGEAGADPQLLQALSLEARPPILRPRPLTEAAAGSLLRAGLGERPAPSVTAACQEATGGNPFLLTELVEELRREPRGPDEVSPAAIRQLTSDRIAGALLLRIGRLDPQAPVLARAVAVLGARARRATAARLAEVEPDAARRLAAALADADVLEAGEPLRFVHPLVRASVYGETSADQRADLHRRAAELLGAEGASPEVVALHLLHTVPAGEVRVVETLSAAARAALARGSPETAISCLCRALEEPPEEEQRPGVLLELGIAEALVADAERAAEHLLAAREGLRAVDRMAATRLLAGVLAMNERSLEAVELLVEEMELLAEGDRDHIACLAADAVNTGRMSPSAWRAARGAAVLLRELVSGGEQRDPDVLAAVAGEMLQAGEPAERTAAIAEHALEVLPPPERWTLSDWSGLVAVRTLVTTERFELARLTLDGVIAALRARGDALLGATAYAYRSDLLHRLGELSRAEEDARVGYELCIEHGWSVGIPALVCWRVVALIERGELDSAQAIVEQRGLAGPAASLPDTYTFNLLLDARGRLRLAQARPREAADDLLECGRRQTELGEINPALVAWRSGAALALLGARDARRAADLAGEELELARAFGARRGLGIALRAAGLVEGGRAGLELLEEAAATLERCPARLEHARALVDLGAATRRAGRAGDARERLAAGMDLAHRCGATALVDRAHGELVLAGARPRRTALSGLDSLTPSERRVAEMAAQGLTNKQIAQSLFVTLRTVEMHLTNSYRKLGVGSRRELAKAVDQRGAPHALGTYGAMPAHQ